jgi:chromate reductase
MSDYTVGYFVGSLSAKSLNRRLARALVRLAPRELDLHEIPYGDLPLFNRDFEGRYPPVATALKQAIERVDAILFVTPEYNRSIPGALKNAIDWASRPKVQNSFTGKPSAVIGASPGALGTAIAQQHLRTLLAYCKSPQLSSEAYIQVTPGLITSEGEVKEDSTREFLRNWMNEFQAFIADHYAARPVVFDL